MINTTPEIIDNTPAGDWLDYQVAAAMGQTDFKHLEFQYAEGVTEDGKDGWDGFYCPRCQRNSGDCVKSYSQSWIHLPELLKWILANSDDFFMEWWQDNEWFLCNLAQPTRMLPNYGDKVVVASSDKVVEDELPNLPLALCRFIMKVKLANENTKGESLC